MAAVLQSQLQSSGWYQDIIKGTSILRSGPQLKFLIPGESFIGFLEQGARQGANK